MSDLHHCRVDRRRGAWMAVVTRIVGLSVSLTSTYAIAASATDERPPMVPAWAFPLNPPTPGDPALYDRIQALHVPNSKVSFTEAELNDLFSAPDWRPASHSATPEIVSHGRPPDVYACGYCHSPSGQGRPENASLAGLPSSYIIQQVADFKSGARRSAWSGPYRPADRMIHAATYATSEEVTAAAQYFSMQRLHPRVVVVERARVPRTHVVGWVYVADDDAGTEPLGERLVEIAPDATRHEHRDDEMRYIAYVPRQSIGRGRSIAHSGSGGRTVPCVTCHGESLRGVGLVPPIAGRSPTYIVRQLLAFQTGARAGVAGKPMQAVVAKLKIGDMIDLAAYAGSLRP